MTPDGLFAQSCWQRRSLCISKARCGAVAFLTALASCAAGCSEAAFSEAPAPSLLTSSFGQRGTAPGCFANPRALSAGRDGCVYVIDKSGRVQRFSASGRYEHEWALPEIDEGFPSGVDVDAIGRVFIADTHYSRILVFDREGRELARFGQRGSGPGQLMLVSDVAVSPDGSIYAAEYGVEDRVSKFDAEGGFLLSFGELGSGLGALRRPSGLDCGGDGTVWVADTNNHRVCQYDSQGRFLTSFGRLGREPGELRYPRDVAILDGGLIAVVESANDRVQCFDRQGRLVFHWGGSGRRAAQLSRPLNIDVAGGRLFVADSGNSRVVILKLPRGRAAEPVDGSSRGSG